MITRICDIMKLIEYFLWMIFVIFCLMTIFGGFYLSIIKLDNREQIDTCSKICGEKEKLIECNNANGGDNSLKIVCIVPETNVTRTVTIKR